MADEVVAQPKAAQRELVIIAHLKALGSCTAEVRMPKDTAAKTLNEMLYAYVYVLLDQGHSDARLVDAIVRRATADVLKARSELRA